MLIYPPGKLIQRGEERCQSSVEDSTATTMRACNDLGYVGAMMKRAGYEIFLKDYQTEKLCLEDLLSDFKSFEADVVFISVSNTSIFSDIEKVNTLKQINPDLIVILKGAIFFDPEEDLLKQLDLKNVDYLIGGESEFIATELIDAHYAKSDLSKIDGILYKKNGKWLKTGFKKWNENLDSLEFPDRSIMNNALYLRPDTHEIQATISTSRGCPSSCIYCMTPKISGKRLRVRSPENIMRELEECYYKYHIRNFFFKSDTFTINSKWVHELCDLIIKSDLYGKIEWVANSRTKPIDPATLKIMKKAGCWLIAFGYESGSEETLKKIKKGATTEDNLKASKYAKQAGLLTYGFFMIGFPWENREHLAATEKHMFDLNPDFVELHLAVPYYGTELYEIAKTEDLIDETVLGKDYFHGGTVGTKFISLDELNKFRKKVIRKYHLRLGYIFKKTYKALLKPKVLGNYCRFGYKILRS